MTATLCCGVVAGSSPWLEALHSTWMLDGLGRYLRHLAQLLGAAKCLQGAEVALPTLTRQLAFQDLSPL
eukprot:6726245-Alexandrium_andersonii.AAC.1